MSDICERNHKRHRLRRRRVEAERLIESFRLIGDGMHDDAADADRIGSMRHTLRAVAKERAAEPPALLRAIDGKAAESNGARRPLSRALARVRSPTATGMGSGILRRKRPALLATAIAPEASA
jgi:hypothetical protein